MPEELKLREIEFTITEKGKRAKGITLPQRCIKNRVSDRLGVPPGRDRFAVWSRSEDNALGEWHASPQSQGVALGYRI